MSKSWQLMYEDAIRARRDDKARIAALEAHLRKADRIEGDIGAEEWYAERDALIGCAPERKGEP